MLTHKYSRLFFSSTNFNIRILKIDDIIYSKTFYFNIKDNQKI